MNPNRKIVKNTIYLYLRILINLFLGIYSSRVVLQALGVEDYGIYNIVGGVVVLFSFLNDSLQAATQRFLNYEMGQNNEHGVKNIFQTAIYIHIILVIVIFLLSETVGLYVVNYQLTLPTGRHDAANVVFQLSILCTLVGIIRIPFNALIIAYEKMSFYAYLSIIETLLKLFTIICLLYVTFDKLILYALIILFIVTLVTICFIVYCKTTIRGISLCPKIHREVYCKMLSFTGWTLFGSMANITAAQGVNICMNHFCGVIINAGIGVANQLNGIIYQFVSNMQLAFNPSLVQHYSSGENEQLRLLLYKSSRYSFYLILLFALPLILNSDFVLHVWLEDNVPPYSGTFLIIILFCSILDAISGPLWVTVQAAGRIKKYQLVISSIIFFNLPLVYFILKYGGNPLLAYSVGILMRLSITIYRVYFLSGIQVIRVWEYVKSVVRPTLVVAIMSFTFSILLSFVLGDFFDTFLANIVLIFLQVGMTGATVFTMGMTSNERWVLIDYLLKIKSKLTRS